MKYVDVFTSQLKAVGRESFSREKKVDVLKFFVLMCKCPKDIVILKLRRRRRAEEEAEVQDR